MTLRINYICDSCGYQKTREERILPRDWTEVVIGRSTAGSDKRFICCSRCTKQILDKFLWEMEEENVD